MATTAEHAYDAFLSYSHSTDGELAPALQLAIERFGSPWYRSRTRRLFRDSTNLAAQPELWGAIERALASSRWFVLLASPAAAASVWVDREVDWWLRNRSAQRLLVVLTEGALGFTTAGRVDPARTTALPPTLVSRMVREPLWVDLRRARAGLDADDPVLRAAVVDVAAAVSEVPKDELVGEHVRLRRQTRRLIRTAVATLSVLLVAAIAAASIAAVQRNEARRQARVATARSLASSVQSLPGTRLDLAQLLAVESYRLDPGEQSRAAMFAAATASPHLVGFLTVGSTITALDADRETAVAGTADGQIIAWNLHSGAQHRIGSLKDPVRTVAVGPDTRTVVAGAGSVAELIVRDQPVRVIPTPAGQEPYWVTISPSGRYAGVLAKTPRTADTGPDDGAASLTVRDLRTGRDRTAPIEPGYERVGFRDDQQLTLAFVDRGFWQRRSVATLAPTDPKVEFSFGTHDLGSAAARNGEFIGYANGAGDIPIYRSANQQPSVRRPDLAGAAGGTAPGAMAISDDGHRVALADGGAITVSDTGPEPPTEFVSLTGNPTVNAGGLVFAGDDDRLVSASADRLALWDLRQQDRISRTVQTQLEYGCSGCGRQYLAVDGQARTVATRTDSQVHVVDLAAADRSVETELDSTGPVAWTFDGLLLAASDAGSGRTLFRGGTAQLSVWPSDPFRRRPVAVLSTAGGSVTVIDDRGDRIVRDARTGALRSTAAAPAGLSTLMARPGTVSLSNDGELMALVGGDDRAYLTKASDAAPHAVGEAGAVSVQVVAGRLYVVRRDGSTEIYSGDGVLSRVVPSAGPELDELVVDPTGTMVAARRTDGSVVIEDARSGTEVGRFDVGAGILGGHSNLAFTADGRRLVSVTGGSELRVWDVTDTGWRDADCLAAGRDLSVAEWRRYAGDSPRATSAAGGSSTASSARTSLPLPVNACRRRPR